MRSKTDETSQRGRENGRPVVLYELNEVPWRVIDWYVARRPQSQLCRVLHEAQTFTSVTYDVGELHPWVTWPTLHRSVYNTTHQIGFINQDLSAAGDYPPVWERVAAQGKRAGVFGSLQSYPPPERAHERYAFYIPDTFAPGPETFPERYACFQRLNLRQTAADRASAKEIRAGADVLKDLGLLWLNGLSYKTSFQLARQLLKEKWHPLQRTRRPMLQAPVAFDVFKHALKRSEPDFCTFFTNHVAGIMHRYWRQAFPEDFEPVPGGPTATDAFHSESLLIAMDYADEQIAFLRDWVDQRSGTLYIASSMGQEAIQREEEDELYIENMEKFLDRLGFKLPIEPRMAMHPDYSFSFLSSTDATEFVRQLSKLRRQDGKPAFFNIDVSGHTVGVAAASGSGFGFVDGQGYIYVVDRAGAELVPLAEFGLACMQRDAGTGYHQPRGSLLRYGRSVVPDSGRSVIETVHIADMILRDLGFNAAGELPCAAQLVAYQPLASPV